MSAKELEPAWQAILEYETIYFRPTLQGCTCGFYRFSFFRFYQRWRPQSGLIVALSGCRGVGVSDGDTFTCLTVERNQIKVRMAQIDAPESKQPYGSQAKHVLSTYIFKQDVLLTVEDRDRYGRTVARVKTRSIDVNAEMVRNGAAWAYRDYLKDRTLLDLELVAREYKRGIWALPIAQQQAPWEWRKIQRGGVPHQRAVLGSAGAAVHSRLGAFSCNVIKSCGQMSGWAEARFQLQQCGNPRIDGDRDGIPCEAICK